MGTADAPATKEPVKDTILTPRFYTTDFDAMAAMDLRPNEVELEAICEEFRKDYNRHHFVHQRQKPSAGRMLCPHGPRRGPSCRVPEQVDGRFRAAA
jgi:magnesium-protoporphyrin IX monomethyl ester (oxidative) cyclase